jgi:hypothetical protein
LQKGKPRNAAAAEVERLINTFQLAADATTQMETGRVIPLAVTPVAAAYQGWCVMYRLVLFRLLAHLIFH